MGDVAVIPPDPLTDPDWSPSRGFLRPGQGGSLRATRLRERRERAQPEPERQRLFCDMYPACMREGTQQGWVWYPGDPVLAEPMPTRYCRSCLATLQLDPAARWSFTRPIAVDAPEPAAEPTPDVDAVDDGAGQDGPPRGLGDRIKAQSRMLRQRAAQEPDSPELVAERERVAAKVGATRRALGLAQLPRRTRKTPSRSPEARAREWKRYKARKRGEVGPLTATEERALKTAARKLGIDPATLAPPD